MARWWTGGILIGSSFAFLALVVAGSDSDQCVEEDCDDVELLHLRRDEAAIGKDDESWYGYATFKVLPWNSATDHVLKRWRKGHVALAMRGGGARSMAGVTGQVRALKNMGLLDEVDQIVAISGTNWAMAPYLFAKGFTSEELLGQVLDPATLTPEFLANNFNGELAASAANPIANPVVNASLQNSPNEEFYVQLIGATYLCRFGLNAALPPGACPSNSNKNQIWAENRLQLKGIKFRNQKLDLAGALTIQRTKIKSYIAGATLIAPEGYTPDRDNIVATRMSPDFSGSPFYADCRTANFTPLNTPLFQNLTDLDDVVVGGGLVESFAFTSTEVPVRDKGQAGKTLMAYAKWLEDNTDNAAVLTLQDAVGIASSVLSLAPWTVGPSKSLATFLLGTVFGRDVNILADDPLAYTARRPYWPVGTKKFGDTGLQDYYLGDQGSLENHGVLEAIRSGATCVISLLNSNQELDASVFNCSTKVVNFTRLQEVAAESPPLYDLFGLALDNPVLPVPVPFLEFAGFDYSNNQVFDTQDLFPIICEATQKRDLLGQPATVYSTDLVTLENKFWGIKAGKKVNILWVFTEKTTNFEALLPEATRESINNGTYDTPGGPAWPFLGTFFPSASGDPSALSPSQANLYAAQTEWSLTQIQPDVEACIEAGSQHHYR
eukprot:CAMPEP_0181432902 /NCGR_PEP_ID=MMETSP1110-20121109/19011_1 /TAXON_ID=174948 /ORGANISM="Symbiodinium sp., Strain CCMP421" /LENGTH=664 /DNA_ID=CAMNT_0023556329 /DNA_START=53 /DNA_END=2047 /DNA_ORIENTATION=-